jgi:hypothetical protein
MNSLQSSVRFLQRRYPGTCTVNGHFLFNVCHADISASSSSAPSPPQQGPITSTLAKYPGFRVLAVFFTDAEMDHFVQTNQTYLRSLGNCYVAPLGELRSVCLNGDLQQNAGYITALISEKLQDYLKYIALLQKDYAQNVMMHAMGDTGKSFQEKHRKAKTQRSFRKTQDKVLKQGKQLQVAEGKVTQTMKDQVGWQFVAAICLPDVKQFREPLFTILNAFKTIDDAKSWTDAHCDLLKKDGFEVDILDMYEWLFPMEVDETKIQLKFSNDEQTKVFEYMSKQSQEAETLMKKQQEDKKKHTEAEAADAPSISPSTIPAPSSPAVSPPAVSPPAVPSTTADATSIPTLNITK